MEISEAICVGILVAIIVFVSATWIGMRIWSALVISFIAGVAVMLSIFPISDLMMCTLGMDVITYICILMLTAVLILVYTTINCFLDIDTTCVSDTNVDSSPKRTATTHIYY